MNVVVKLFGAEADAAGREEIAVPLEEASTCARLRQRLAELEPRLGSHLPACRFAVNHEFVGDDYRLAEDDEVALIGLVSGG